VLTINQASNQKRTEGNKNMMKGTPPILDDYKLMYLTRDEEPQVEALLERCADYLDLVAGVEPSRKLARDLLTALPPGK
jgi:hypothetical protein